MVRKTICSLVLIILAGCSGRPVIVVGSKNFTEQVMLGELISQQIERRMDVAVQRKLYLGGTLLTHEALKGGSIDLYPEYTGTALTAVLKKDLKRGAKEVLTSVREAYKPWGLTWLEPLGFNNTFAMVVRTEDAQRLTARTLSAAAARPEPWKIGVGYEFVQRKDGLPGLVEAYRLRLAGDPLTMDLGLLYPALQSRKIEMGAASATDGQLARAEYTVLSDDHSYFPPYDCAIVVRDATLVEFPQLRQVLSELSGKINEASMSRMNAAVDRDHRSVVDVAREFLAAK